MEEHEVIQKKISQIETISIALASININESLKIIPDPTTFSSAWHHQINDEQVQWRKEIKKELNDMKVRNVWTKVKQREEMRLID